MKVMVSPETGLTRVSPARITGVTSWLSGGHEGRWFSSGSSSSARPSSSFPGGPASWGTQRSTPMLGVDVPLAPVAEIGLFPLGVVLLPPERVPLHIFEPRYRELIEECLETDAEFGLVYADEGGIREAGRRRGAPGGRDARAGHRRAGALGRRPPEHPRRRRRALPRRGAHARALVHDGGDRGG